jgi:hypothetical protein
MPKSATMPWSLTWKAPKTVKLRIVVEPTANVSEALAATVMPSFAMANVNVPWASVSPPTVRLPDAITKTLPGAMLLFPIVTEALLVLTSNQKVICVSRLKPSELGMPVARFIPKTALIPWLLTWKMPLTEKLRIVVEPTVNASEAVAATLRTFVPTVKVNVPWKANPPTVSAPDATTEP